MGMKNWLIRAIDGDEELAGPCHAPSLALEQIAHIHTAHAFRSSTQCCGYNNRHKHARQLSAYGLVPLRGLFHTDLEASDLLVQGPLRGEQLPGCFFLLQCF